LAFSGSARQWVQDAWVKVRPGEPLTAKSLSDAVGVPLPAVYGILKGERSTKIETLWTIADKLGVSRPRYETVVVSDQWVPSPVGWIAEAEAALAKAKAMLQEGGPTGSDRAIADPKALVDDVERTVAAAMSPKPKADRKKKAG